MSHELFLERVRGAASDPKQALKLTLDEFRADTGTIHLLGDDGLLHLEASVGGIPDDLLEVIRKIPPGKGLAGLAFERRKAVDLCNLQTDGSGQARPRAKETGVRGSICVPIMDGDQPVGVLGVATVMERDFSPEETDRLFEVGRILAAEAK